MIWSALAVLLVMLPPAKPLDAEQVKRLANAACVRVGDRGGSREGSGVIIGRRDGFLYLLTAAHVVDGLKDLVVMLPEKRATEAKPLGEVELLLCGKSQDFALLRVASKAQLSPLPLAREAPDGDKAFDAFSAGFAGCRVEPVAGKKLLRRKDGTSIFAWECRDRPEPGRSGGPLIDAQGKVIGICIGTQNGKGYYCHLDEIIALLKKSDYAWLCGGN